MAAARAARAGPPTRRRRRRRAAGAPRPAKPPPATEGAAAAPPKSVTQERALVGRIAARIEQQLGEGLLDAQKLSTGPTGSARASARAPVAPRGAAFPSLGRQRSKSLTADVGGGLPPALAALATALGLGDEVSRRRRR